MPYILPAFPAAAALLARHFSPEFEADRRRWNIQIMMWLWMVPGLLAAGFLSGHIRHFGIQASATLLAISFLAGAFSRKFLRMALCWGVVQIALILAAPKLAKDYSDFGLAQIANTAHADKVVGFHCYPQSFPLVMKEPLTVVEFQGELASDGKMSPELFWDRDKFWTLWNSDKRVIACLRPEFLSLFERPGFKPGRQIGRNRRFILMANYK